MAPIQARSPYTPTSIANPSIWSPLTSPNPLMDSLINHQTNSWTFANGDFWQSSPQNEKRPAIRPSVQSANHSPVRPAIHPTRHNFVPSYQHTKQMTIEPGKLFNDLEKLLADDLSDRMEKRVNNRPPMNQLSINQFGLNQFGLNQFGLNQSPVNQRPVNHSPFDKHSVGPTRRLPIFRGLSGSSTDVSPSSCIGERVQGSKSFAENEHDQSLDDYYQSFDQIDDLEIDDLLVDYSWPAESHSSAGFQTPDSAYASYAGTPANSRTNSQSSTGASPLVRTMVKPATVVARRPELPARPKAVTFPSSGNWRSELVPTQPKEWEARISVSEHQRLSFLLNIMNDNRIHVSNIPFDYTTLDLYKFYMDRNYGQINEVELISNERGSKGFGFLSFENGWLALRARLETDGLAVPYKTKPGTRVLEVNRANPKKRAQEQK